ncbi:MAG: hypothetical protein N3E37_05445 [Candidatus Micrarchaeota archaeon]|nr:hypothetical protein [Candidatus Micrarchaeota archaeon]
MIRRRKEMWKRKNGTFWCAWNNVGIDTLGIHEGKADLLLFHNGTLLNEDLHFVDKKVEEKGEKLPHGKSDSYSLSRYLSHYFTDINDMKKYLKTLEGKHGYQRFVLLSSSDPENPELLPRKEFIAVNGIYFSNNGYL